MKIPRYVPEECVEYLNDLLYDGHPKIEDVVCDIRTRSAWTTLLNTNASNQKIGAFVSATIYADREYKLARKSRREFITKCKQVSKVSKKLSRLLNELLTEHKTDDQVDNFLHHDLTSVDHLLFQSVDDLYFDVSLEETRKTKEEFTDLVNSYRTWARLRHWICPNACDPRCNWDSNRHHDEDWGAVATRLLSVCGPTSQTEPEYDEPSEGARRFLSDAWLVAPKLTDVLDRVTRITKNVEKAGFAYDPTMEATLLSRKSSEKRDYLRALLYNLIMYQPRFLLEFVDRRSELISLVAAFGTVVLRLSDDDMITDADVRQSLNQVLPMIERKLYVQVRIRQRHPDFPSMEHQQQLVDYLRTNSP